MSQQILCKDGRYFCTHRSKKSSKKSKILFLFLILFVLLSLVYQTLLFYQRELQTLLWSLQEDQAQVTVVERGNHGLSLEKLFNFQVHVGEMPEQFNNLNYKEHGIYDKIQVASQLDQTKIQKKINFTRLYIDMTSSMSYSLIVPPQIFNIEKVPDKLQLKSRSLRDQQQKDYSNKNYSQILYFGIRVAKYPDDPRIREQEYQYYDRKYNIGKDVIEQPICVFSMGYNIYSKGQYQPLFQSLNRQNYTNFHVVYVDDNSRDHTSQKIYEYLRNNPSRVSNRIKIVKNHHRFGALANMYFWVRKLCDEDDIVIIIDSDDSLMGAQALKVVNSVYKDPNHWFVYTKYIKHFAQKGSFGDGISVQMTNTAEYYRTQEQMWVTSHLRTFRKKLMDAVPIEYYMEYEYNYKTGKASAVFHRSACDRFQVYSHLELAGQDRILHINDYLYLYEVNEGTMTMCYRQRQEYDQYKSRIQTPLARLQSWSAKPNPVYNYSVPASVIAGLKNKYFEYNYCVNKQQVS